MIAEINWNVKLRNMQEFLPKWSGIFGDLTLKDLKRLPKPQFDALWNILPEDIKYDVLVPHEHMKCVHCGQPVTTKTKKYDFQYFNGLCNECCTDMTRDMRVPNFDHGEENAVPSLLQEDILRRHGIVLESTPIPLRKWDAYNNSPLSVESECCGYNVK